MHTFSQWAHQHDLLLGMIVVLVVSLGLLVRYRRRSARLWIAWGTALGLGAAALVALRTPETSLSEHVSHLPSGSNVISVTDFTAAEYKLDHPGFRSVEAIEELLCNRAKHTLVEIYADFGMS